MSVPEWIAIGISSALTINETTDILKASILITSLPALTGGVVFMCICFTMRIVV